MKEYQAIGLSVAVVKNEQIIYSRAFGKKDMETGAKLKESDIFRIASISKSFTATSLMQQVEAGRCSLDDDFGKLIGFPVRNPHFPDEVITLRMVLSHTSSINDSQGYFDLDKINPAKNPKWDSCYSDYKPGSRYRYCNLNYNMAGAVLERLSGQRFDSYVAQHILKPLGLYGGYCVDSLDASKFVQLYEFDSASQSFQRAVNAYNPRREELASYSPGYSTPVFSPTGGMKISAPDLARYMIMHMDKGSANGIKIIDPASSGQMQSVIAVDAGYGLALYNTEKFIAGKRMTGHTGSAYGLYSVMFFQPQEKFGLVLITNGCRPEYKNGYNAFLFQCAQVLYRQFIETL